MTLLRPVHLLVDRALFLYNFTQKGGILMDENGLLLDDDLFPLEVDDDV